MASRTRAISSRHMGGVADADRIGKGNLDWPCLGKRSRHFDNTVLRDFTFKRAAERSCDRALGGAAFGICKGDNAFGRLNRFVAGLALVGHRKTVGCHGHGPKLVDTACGQRTFRAAHIHDQADKGHVVPHGQSSAYRFGVGHLRDAGRVDETRHFDPPRTGVYRTADQRQLVRCGHKQLFILQAITWPDFDKFYATGNAHHN